MDTFGDPTWVHHQQAAQLWGLTALRLATTPVAKFNASAYTAKLQQYLFSLRELVTETSSSDSDMDGIDLRLDVLEDAINSLDQYAKRLDYRASALEFNLTHKVCYFQFFCRTRFRRPEVEIVNKAYLEFERGFIGKGLPGRPIYKHVVYAPGKWEGYGGVTFPSVRDAIQEKRWQDAKDEIEEIAALFKKASSKTFGP
jgi:N-acetylated-alpha-linked acidic dipeptidase